MACNAQCFTAPRLQAQRKQCKQGRIQLTHVPQPAHPAPAGSGGRAGRATPCLQRSRHPVASSTTQLARLPVCSGGARARAPHRPSATMATSGGLTSGAACSPPIAPMLDTVSVPPARSSPASRPAAAAACSRPSSAAMPARLRSWARFTLGTCAPGGRVAAARCVGRVCRGPPAHWLLAGGRPARSLSGALPAGAGVLAGGAQPALQPYAPPTPGAPLPSRTTRGQLRAFLTVHAEVGLPSVRAAAWRRGRATRPDGVAMATPMLCAACCTSASPSARRLLFSSGKSASATDSACARDAALPSGCASRQVT